MEGSEISEQESKEQQEDQWLCGSDAVMAIHGISNAKETKKMQRTLERFEPSDIDVDPAVLYDEDSSTTVIRAEYLFRLAELARGAKAKILRLTIRDDHPLYVEFAGEIEQHGERGEAVIAPVIDESAGFPPFRPPYETFYAVVNEKPREEYEHNPLVIAGTEETDEMYADRGAAFDACDRSREECGNEHLEVYELRARRVERGDEK